ncbi:hypothetical protein [Luteitalea sp.]
MSWDEAAKVGAVVIASLGGGGFIVWALAGQLGRLWVERFKGDIEAKLKRLESRLSVGNSLLARFNEYELEAIRECSSRARVCVPLLNAVRPMNSGKDRERLVRDANALGDAHNELVRAMTRHEPFLPGDLRNGLDETAKLVRLELLQAQSEEPFTSRWWEEALKNQEDAKAQAESLLTLVREHLARLRASAESLHTE